MRARRVITAIVVLVLLAGCATRRPPTRRPLPSIKLPPIDYTVQVGAFGDVENAIRLAQALEPWGVEAYHFVGNDGLHRVRFGIFSTREIAIEGAEALKAHHVIEEYHIVSTSIGAWTDQGGLREGIVSSAMSFLGRPYRWGGADTAFDCSGLTMTAYRLNGLGLPRSSAEQYATGASIGTHALQKGDLVFFAINRRDKPSHVGLYVGDGRFIHAPGTGKVVRVDDLRGDYYTRHFLDARTYLE